MKYLPSQIMTFLHERGAKHNMIVLRRFFITLCIMIAAYSVIFHWLMEYEGKEHSWITGVYWTLTVMSTLGFGDITFSSDPGRIFSIIVLMSGVIFFLIMMPFTFIQHFYMPWLESQKKDMVPRRLPAGIRGHVLIAGSGPITLNLADDLARHGIRRVLLCNDPQTGLDLLDQGYEVAAGDHDDVKTYQKLHADTAAMLVVMDTDIRSTNIVFSAREAAPQVVIAAGVENPDATDILRLAGCNRVFQFHNVLGEAMARRVVRSSQRASIMGRFGRLVVADIGIRLVREDFFLATPEEMVFPRSGLSLQSSQVTMMTPGEAESVSKNGQTIPDVAQEIALRSQRLVRVLGKHSLVTDGYRTYFMEEGEYPAEIASLGEGERKE